MVPRHRSALRERASAPNQHHVPRMPRRSRSGGGGTSRASCRAAAVCSVARRSRASIPSSPSRSASWSPSTRWRCSAACRRRGGPQCMPLPVDGSGAPWPIQLSGFPCVTPAGCQEGGLVSEGVRRSWRGWSCTVHQEGHKICVTAGEKLRCNKLHKLHRLLLTKLPLIVIGRKFAEKYI